MMMILEWETMNKRFRRVYAIDLTKDVGFSLNDRLIGRHSIVIKPQDKSKIKTVLPEEFSL